MVDEDESGIFRCKRFIRADWFGHDILLQRGKGVVAAADGAMPSIVAAAPSTVD
jgi:hypothetical protein